jgi:hypothetical protein
MGNDTDVASHVGGMGTGIRILRIQESETLSVSAARDGGCRGTGYGRQQERGAYGFSGLVDLFGQFDGG